MDILKIRKSLGMTQKEFGDAIGVDKSVVYKYEHGLAKPPKKRMERIDYLVSTKCGTASLVEFEPKDTSYKDRLLTYAKLLILMKCDGCCEMCGEDAPFRDKDDRPYLLFYKVDDDNDLDPIHHYVALCPNCHAEMMVLDNSQQKEKLKRIAQQHNF